VPVDNPRQSKPAGVRHSVLDIAETSGEQRTLRGLACPIRRLHRRATPNEAQFDSPETVVYVDLDKCSAICEGRLCPSRRWGSSPSAARVGPVRLRSDLMDASVSVDNQ
jgi:hypothetical protein